MRWAVLAFWLAAAGLMLAGAAGCFFIRQPTFAIVNIKKYDIEVPGHAGYVLATSDRNIKNYESYHTSDTAEFESYRAEGKVRLIPAGAMVEVLRRHRNYPDWFVVKYNDEEWYLPGCYLKDRRGRPLDANYEL